MENTRLRQEKFYKSTSGKDFLTVLVHRSQKIKLKDAKNHKSPVPPKNTQSPPNLSSRHSSKSPSCPKLPNLKAPIAVNSVEFPINYYDQLTTLFLPEVNKSQKRPANNSVNPRIVSQLKTQKLSEAGIIEFKPDFPQKIQEKLYLKKQKKKTAEFAGNVNFQLNIIDQIKELLPVAESGKGDEDDLEERKVVKVKVAKNLSRLKRAEKNERIEEENSMLTGWTLQESEILWSD